MQASGLPLMRGAKANVLDAVGNTPLVKLSRLGRHTKADFYVKCEFLNPGGSTKDRIAINIIDKAEQAGVLKAGGTIVEATSGNTGMGLALVAAVRGYKSILVMPDKISTDKVATLRAVGAKVVICPTDVDPQDPRSYYSVSRRLADETPNAFYANQYHNPANPQAHYVSTGPEIWAQTGGDFDVFCAGMGTGGTLSGSGQFFKERKPTVQIVGVDPIGSLYYNYFKSGQMTGAFPYKVEGIGEDFLPSTMNLHILDQVVQVTDKESFVTARNLVRQEGILGGGSAGAAVAGAIKYAEAARKPLRIIVHLADSAVRYLSKYLDDDWMRKHGFAEGQNTSGTVRQLLAGRGDRPVETAQADDKVRDVVNRMKQHGISQLPVVDGGRLLGVVSERNLLAALLHDETSFNGSVGALADQAFPAIDQDTSIMTVSGLLDQGAAAAMVLQDSRVIGVVTKIDLIAYMAAKMAP